MLRKCLPKGEMRYPDNQVVMSISEAHRVLSNDPVELIPIETIFSDAGNQLPIGKRCSDILKRSWAKFNQAYYVEWSDRTRDVRTREPQKVFQTE
jgi:hypothetical protein